MSDNYPIIIQSSFGSVFSVFSKEERKKLKGNDRKIGICGKVNNPGIIDIPTGATLAEVITIAGGIINDSGFKAAQIGMPFGGFLGPNELDKELKIEKNDQAILIILSQEDCVIQYCKFYIEYILANLENDEYIEYKKVQSEFKDMWKILDRISKGRSNERDIYFLRNLSKDVKVKMNQTYNMIEEIIDNFYDEIQEHIKDNKCYTFQCNHLIKLTITSKCIGCGACKRVCPVDCIEGTPKAKHHIDYDRCTHCGQCMAACPVNAITAGDNSLKFLRDLSIPNKIVITQMAPAVRVAIGEAFGLDPGINIEKKIAKGLRLLGVDYVFDTTWAADLTIMEEAAEFQDRLERYMSGDKSVRLPMLTSCCPAWVKFIEQNYGDMLDVPSTAKSPMMMFATVAKDIWAQENNLKREEVTSVSIMPCIAKKYEASRQEFSRDLNYDVDYVITTEELIGIFKDSNINLLELEDGQIDQVMGEYTGAGMIFGRTGGVIEAAIRTAVENITGERLKDVEFECLRGFEGFRSCNINVKDIELKIGVAYGLKEAGKMLDKIRTGEEFYHAIEIMACLGGCVGGGGQPKAKKRIETVQRRAEGLNQIDKECKIRISKDNSAVKSIYDKYLDYPMSHKAHELLHTKYFMK